MNKIFIYYLVLQNIYFMRLSCPKVLLFCSADGKIKKLGLMAIIVKKREIVWKIYLRQQKTLP